MSLHYYLSGPNARALHPHTDTNEYELYDVSPCSHHTRALALVNSLAESLSINSLAPNCGLHVILRMPLQHCLPQSKSSPAGGRELRSARHDGGVWCQ